MILFLYGADTFRSRRKLDEIVGKFRVEHDPSGMNTVLLDAASVALGDIQQALYAPPFLGTRRMVVLCGVFGLKKDEQKPFVTLIENVPSTTVLVLHENIDALTSKKSVLWESATASKFHWEFAPLTGSALVAWVDAEVATHGVVFAPSARAAFIEAVGSDSARASHEIAKLAAYVGSVPSPHPNPLLKEERVSHITANDVALLINGEVAEDMFGFLDAVAAKQSRAAAALLEEQISAGTEPMQLLAMLARTVRLLLQARDLLDRGVPQNEALRALGVHPFAGRKALTQARAFDATALRALHRTLLDTDRKVKTGLTPTPRVLLDLLVTKATV